MSKQTPAQRAAERIASECLGESEGFHRRVTFDRNRAARIIEEEHAEITADRDRLLAALLQAVTIIQSWHGMGMIKVAADTAWDIYWGRAPEMRAIRDALPEVDRG